MAKLELTWVGKDQRVRPEPRIMLPDATLEELRSSGDDGILVQSDNLLALAALEFEYTGKIKCVFIDPPYNTGSAFEHYDDGLEHSIWLSLMRDRLERLHRLLRIDGSLWITIDDNEVHYLKILCDEIFGRQNFISNIVWQKKYTIANDAQYFSDQHDHILVYAKSKADWRPNRLPRSETMNARYSNPDGHPKGPWKATPLHAKSGSATGRNFRYVFSNGVVWSPPSGTFPRFSAETLARLDAMGEIWFGRDGTAAPSRKTFLSELSEDGVPAATVWLHGDVGNNHEAKTEVKAFNSEDVFATPKPERLLHRILTLATRPGDLVLDSFAGSGTTGAVAHKMRRRWIMVEMGEHARTHILPRLKMVVDGRDQGGITKLAGWKGGGGFCFFRLAPSLIETDKWGRQIISRKYNASMLAEALCKLEGFKYQPSELDYWNHGYSSERDFIWVTTQTLTPEQIETLSDDVGPNRSLLVLCAAYRGPSERFANLTIRKIPDHIRTRCEWGRDNYSLNIDELPAELPEKLPMQKDLFAELVD